MTEDQKDLIREMTPEQWESACACARAILTKLQAKVLKADVSKGFRDIVLAKAAADGGSAIIDGMERAKRELMKES